MILRFEGERNTMVTENGNPTTVEISFAFVAKDATSVYQKVQERGTLISVDPNAAVVRVQNDEGRDYIYIIPMGSADYAAISSDHIPVRANRPSGLVVPTKHIPDAVLDSINRGGPLGHPTR